MESASGEKKVNTVVKMLRETIIPARSISIVDARVGMIGNVVVNPHNFSPTLIGANSVATSNNNTIPFVLANLDVHPVKVAENTILGSLESLSDAERVEDVSVKLSTIMKLNNSTEAVNVGGNLTNEQLADLSTLIHCNIQAFSINGELGSTNILTHKIELTEEARPFREPHRRRPKTHVDEAKKQVEEMLREGVIEESNSPWASAYLLVKKKNGKMRMCIDFRRLNSMTKKSSYPLPNIDECLENLAGKRYFSNLDLASGFWQIPVDESSREYTAFRTEEGLFHFKKMPFGLCNAPASFQKMVNVLFTGLKGMSMQIFIDDICIATYDWNEHLQMLDKIFKLLIQANLKLKADKCTFGAEEVTFLGHILSANGIRQDPEKLKAITCLPPPANVNELYRILGMLGYYRRFVPNYSMLSAPLNNLLKKNVPYVWTQTHDLALSNLINALRDNATLKYFRYGRPTVLKTDASKEGVGAILQQRDDDGCWKLVVCCSKGLTPAQKNYGVSELEALAIVYAVTKLRPYLLGHQFTILTDHCALCALNLKEPKSERLKRWALYLSSFNFIIKYIKGGLHKDVDCISRKPLVEPDDEFADSYALNINVNTNNNICSLLMPQNTESWLDALNEDPATGEIYELAARNENEFSDKNGILYKSNKLYVPLKFREKILKEAHDEPTAAHGGIDATFSRLNDKYWWKSMRKDTESFVSSCHICQCRKAERQLPSGTMQHHQVLEPLQMVAFDCLGPLSETTNNKKHIIVGIDMFSRFIVAKAVKRIDAESFCNYFLTFVGNFGVPKGILTDNAPTFINSHVSNLTKLFNIKHFKATPHHSRGNSVAERAIQSLQEKLSLLESNNTLNEWSRALPTAVLALNTTVHKSLGFAPFTLLFGRRPALHSSVSNSSKNIYDLHVELIEQTLDNVHAEAIARQSDAQAASRSHFERNHVARSFNVGDLVSSRRMGRKAKLTSRFIGPFKVLARDKDIYTIESVDEKTKMNRHIKDLGSSFD